MMQLKITAKNKNGLVTAELTMLGGFFDVNGVLSQFKVLVSPSDADQFFLDVQGQLRPGANAVKTVAAA